MTSQAALAARRVVGAEVLVIDQDASVRVGIERLFTRADLNVTSVENPSDATPLLAERFFAVVVVDLDTPHPGGGLATIGAVLTASPRSSVVALIPRRAFDVAVSATRAGAIDVIVKSPESVAYLADRIKEAAAAALARRQLQSTIGDVRELQEVLVDRLMDAERRAYHLDADRGSRATRSPLGAVLTVLVVAADGVVHDALAAAAPAGFRFVAAHSGGEALDRAASDGVNLALVADEQRELPASMVVRSLKAAHPDALVAVMAGPRPGGTVDVVEGNQRVRVIDGFTDVQVLVERLDQLAEATRARERERRFLQAFRERHYELLRRLATLRQRLDAAAPR